MVNPAVNAVLIPLALKDRYNVNPPHAMAMNVVLSIVATRRSLCINDGSFRIRASVAISETLRLNLTQPNGRLSVDDVIDTLLFLIFNNTPVSEGLDTNVMLFVDGFPFLATPDQPDQIVRIVY